MACFMSMDKRQSAISTISEMMVNEYVTRRELHVLTGKLYFLTRVLRQVGAFLARCIGLIRGPRRHLLQVSPSLKADLSWYLGWNNTGHR